jgi:hypothetical protein
MLNYKLDLGQFGDSNLIATPLNFFQLRYVKKIKDNNRGSFFYNKKLSYRRHFKWYKQYCKKQDDILYILKIENKRYGTVGIRKFALGYELYSVIRDKNIRYYPNLMQAMVKKLIMNYAEEDIYCSVVAKNSAVEWYLKLGFKIESSNSQFNSLVLRKEP